MITLKKSPIGCLPKQRATLKALGLTKVNKTVEKENNEFIQGMIKVVGHLIKVEEKQGGVHELQYTEGARKTRKRVGRGTSSGTGKTAGRGQKGQGARSGGGKKPGFEGGQTPLFMRLPKRGFTNFNKLEYAIVNLDQLNTFEAGTVVCPKALKEAGLIKKELDGVKVLGNGTLEKAITVKAHKFSKSALAAIEAAGGKTEVI